MTISFRKSNILPTFFICFVFFSSFTPLPCLSDSIINVWPKPRIFHWPTPLATYLSPHFIITSPFHQHLSVAIHRYKYQILTEHYRPLVTPEINLTKSASILRILTIKISDLTAQLQHGVDESYNLTIPTTGPAVLTASTAWGAMRGLETFSQLVWGGGLFSSSSPMVAVGLSIWDAPLFPHRGIVLDTSRNFYDVEDIMRTIRAMSANKLNVFHWHIVDSQSFPIVLPSEPELAGKGSYGPNMQYSPDDVQKIVKFGYQHGVRIMPEIDSPGHTAAWAEAYPDIVTCAKSFWWPTGYDSADRLALEPGAGQLNPLNPNTYRVVKNVINDIVSLFPENFYHGGADEVVHGCWKADASIQSFISDGGTYSQLLEKFINTTLPFILARNRTVVYWEDVLLDADIKVRPSLLPPKHTILQSWNGGPTNIKRIVSSGYRAIVSTSDYYYLDCGHGGFLGNDSQYDQPPGTSQGSGGSWCAPYKTWQTIYNYDITYGLNATEAKLVLGGEVALWSEQADPTVLDSWLWPRASAMAEALWSGNRDEKAGKKRYAEATDRLNEWRYRMVRMGVRAKPIQPLWCVRNPGMCNAVQPA